MGKWKWNGNGMEMEWKWMALNNHHIVTYLLRLHLPGVGWFYAASFNYI